MINEEGKAGNPDEPLTMGAALVICVFIAVMAVIYAICYCLAKRPVFALACVALGYWLAIS